MGGSHRGSLEARDKRGHQNFLGLCVCMHEWRGEGREKRERDWGHGLLPAIVIILLDCSCFPSDVGINDEYI